MSFNWFSLQPWYSWRVPRTPNPKRVVRLHQAVNFLKRYYRRLTWSGSYHGGRRFESCFRYQFSSLYGGMAELANASALKAEVPKGHGGSKPSPSANLIFKLGIYKDNFGELVKPSYDTSLLMRRGRKVARRSEACTLRQ